MSDTAGRKATLATSTDGNTYVAIAGIKNITVTMEGKAIDTTDHDSGVWEEFIAGRDNVKLKFDGNFDPADAGFDALWNATTGRTIVYFRYRPDVGSGIAQYIGQGILTHLEKSSGNDAANQFSGEVQITSTWAKSSQ